MATVGGVPCCRRCNLRPNYSNSARTPNCSLREGATYHHVFVSLDAGVNTGRQRAVLAQHSSIFYCKYSNQLSGVAINAAVDDRPRLNSALVGALHHSRRVFRMAADSGLFSVAENVAMCSSRFQVFDIRKL